MWSHSPDDSEADHCPSCGDKQEKSRIWSNLIETSGGARVWEWHVVWLVQPNYRYKTNQHAPGLLSTVNWHQFVVVENCGLASPHYPSLTNISNQWWRLSHLLSKYWLDIKIETENRITWMVSRTNVWPRKTFCGGISGFPTRKSQPIALTVQSQKVWNPSTLLTLKCWNSLLCW